MDRRVFVAGTLGLLAAPLAAEVQAPSGGPRIGFLSTASLASLSPRLEALRQGLRGLGYVEGQNLSIDYRSAEGNSARLPALAADLARLHVECIVTAGDNPARAAQRATS